MAKITRFTPRRTLPPADARLLRAADRAFGRKPGLAPRRPARRQRVGTWPQTLGGLVFGLVVVAGALAWQPVSTALMATVADRAGIAAPAGAAGADTTSIRFGICAGARDSNCVIDGDTVRFSGMTVRIADIDTPETRDYGCAGEKTLGDAATRRILTLLNAGPFEVRTYARDEDVYGRKLRILARDGVSLGETLVAEGLARRWDGARRSWC